MVGIAPQPPPTVGDIALPDGTAGGAPFTLRASDGGLLLVYFGYTNCPDECPTTLADVRAALGGLPAEDAARVGLAMITIDPRRDTAQALTRFVRGFVPGAHALRTDDDAALRRAADAFGTDYQVTVEPSGTEDVGHVTFLYAVDDHGRLRLQWPYGTRARDIRADIARLLAAGGEA